MANALCQSLSCTALLSGAQSCSLSDAKSPFLTGSATTKSPTLSSKSIKTSQRAAGAGQGKSISAVQTEEEVKSSVQSEKPEKDKGFLFNLLLKGRTREDKVNQLKSVKTVGTLFNDSFKYTSWPECFRVLTERKLKSYTPAEARAMWENGEVTLIDVREPQDFQEVHAEGSKSAALFRLIQGSDTKANMRRLGNALIANFQGTERNPNFIEDALVAVDNDKTKPVIVMCQTGGTLETTIVRGGSKPKEFKDPYRTFGNKSRSLKACYELQEAGFTNVFHLAGGLSQWNHEKFPVVTEK